MENRKTYLAGIDFIRIIACLMIFAFHTRGFMELSYGFLNEYVNQGAIFCSVFFVVSGFSLYLSNNKRNLMQITDMKAFYKKRFIGIMPAYIVVWIGYYVFLGGTNGMAVDKFFILFPIDFFGIRCELLYLPGMNYFWYISCLMISYIIYPFMQEVVKQLKIRETVVLVVVLYFLLIYCKYCEDYFETSVITYYVPVFRVFQVLIGMSCCKFMKYINESESVKTSILPKIKICVLVISTLFFVFLYKNFLKYGNEWMWYDIFIIPCLVGILTNIDCINIHKGLLQSVTKFIAGISYEVYLFQVWIIAFFTKTAMGIEFFENKNNITRIVIVWISTFVISYLFNRGIRFISTYVANFMKNKVIELR